MTKSKTILVFITIFFILAMVIMPTISNAAPDPIKNPGEWKPGDPNNKDITAITKKSNQILSAVSIVGTIASVLTLTILGIKYMVGSIEEKAEYKKSMVPYLIGAVLLFATSTIVSLISKVTEQSLSNI